MKIKHYLLFMTLVSLLGAFALLYVSWRQMRKASLADEDFSVLVESSGKASPLWRQAMKVSRESRDVVMAMDFFADEQSVLFQFVENMLQELGNSIKLLRKTESAPDEIVREVEKAFEDFNRTSVKLGSLAVAENGELFPQPDIGRSSASFVQAVEKLDSWVDQFIIEEKEKMEAAKARIIETRKDSFSLIGIASVAYLLVMLALGYLIHNSFLIPVSRMAKAADEALSERKSFTESSFKEVPAGSSRRSRVKSLFRKETGPKEIETLSSRLWQLVHKLEEAVDERTKQLADRTEKLQNEMENRRKLEADLQHAQKMEAVGQMASGIAHEIRTPAQFAGDHLSFLKSFVEESFEKEVFSKIEFQDASFMEKNVPTALNSIQKGLDQITEIISAMKRFSYKDMRSSLTPTDLNLIIKDCISISRNEWKKSAAMETELDDGLPLVPCRVSEISQVVLNLILNASHAISGFKKNEIGKIRVSTTMEDEEQVRVSVADDGGGIPEDAAERVFEPFFTTKEMGVGTGQGLAISYNLVVERHRGKIFFDTVEGEGTTFHVLLPVSHPATAEEDPEDFSI